jgi:rare lipoprotein A (peptidoglycan hydrolase)
MRKLILAVFFVFTCSYFSNPIQSAEAYRYPTVNAPKTHETKSPQNKSIASWYGPRFHGKKPLTVKDSTCMQ